MSRSKTIQVLYRLHFYYYYDTSQTENFFPFYSSYICANGFTVFKAKGFASIFDILTKCKYDRVFRQEVMKLISNQASQGELISQHRFSLNHHSVS